ncbi:MAG: Cu(I)-responsive transcriptional regulator [Burkholderiaceae bacterium]|nr:Cu(I)-responsive transcriptional regulator [Burkholderiaceae bacterium]
MNIGQAAQAAGLTAKMIRHYEGFGLIPEASRSDSGYRQYSARDVAMLRFIRQARSIGFSIKQIENLLGLWADTARHSRAVKAVATGHIAELDRKMAEMAQMKAALQEIADGCEGDDRADCPILSKLSGGAAGQGSGAGLERTTGKRGARPVRAAHPAKPQGFEHGGLVAWMRSVHRAEGAMRE